MFIKLYLYLEETRYRSHSLRRYLEIIQWICGNRNNGIFSKIQDSSSQKMQGTWWQSLKQMDKGYLFPLTVDAKAKRYTEKSKGYMYIPVGSWNGSEYVGILAFDLDDARDWFLSGTYDIAVLGGTPIDFASYTSVDMGPAFSMILTMRITVKEDKKNEGKIKSGKFQTLGSAVQYVIPPPPDDADGIFVGTRALKGKYISVNKVPQDVLDLLVP